MERGFAHLGARLMADPRAAAVLVVWDGATSIALLAAVLAATGAGGAVAAMAAIITTPVFFLRHSLSETAWQRFVLGDPRPSWIAYRVGVDEARTVGAVLGAGVLAGLILLLAALPLAVIIPLTGESDFLLFMAVLAILAALTALAPRALTVVSLTTLRRRLAVFDDFAEAGRVQGSLFAAGLLYLLLMGLATMLALMPLVAALGSFQEAGLLVDQAGDRALARPLSAVELTAIVAYAVLATIGWQIARAVCARAALDLEAAAESTPPAFSGARDHAPATA